MFIGNEIAQIKCNASKKNLASNHQLRNVPKMLPQKHHFVIVASKGDDRAPVGSKIYLKMITLSQSLWFRLAEKHNRYSSDSKVHKGCLKQTNGLHFGV